jgi:hypothetical protein
MHGGGLCCVVESCRVAPTRSHGGSRRNRAARQRCGVGGRHRRRARARGHGWSGGAGLDCIRHNLWRRRTRLSSARRPIVSFGESAMAGVRAVRRPVLERRVGFTPGPRLTSLVASPCLSPGPSHDRPAPDRCRADGRELGCGANGPDCHWEHASRGPCRAARVRGCRRAGLRVAGSRRLRQVG